MGTPFKKRERENSKKQIATINIPERSAEFELHSVGVREGVLGSDGQLSPRRDSVIPASGEGVSALCALG